MPLQEEFDRQGIWLFRWRSYLPLLLVVLLMFQMLSFHYFYNTEFGDHLWEALCLGVGFFGLVIRAITIGHTPAHTSGRNTKKQVAEKLNTTGIYSIVRHPLYLGNFFMLLGVVMFTHNVLTVLIFILLFWIYYERIMYAEEAFLRNKFGNKYMEWGSRTPAFFPRWRNYVKPDLPFSLKTVLSREYSGLLGLTSSLFILELAGELIVNRKLEFDLHWIIIMSASFIIWLVLRTLKKTTNLLKVEGR